MRQWPRLLSGAGLSLLGLVAGITPNVSANYIWHQFRGHEYALTRTWSTWTEAEAEAVSQGGHLVTINDVDENTWLTETFRDTYNVCGGQNPCPDPGQAIAWIGYYKDGDTWKWSSGESTSFPPPWAPNFPVGGVYAYLHVPPHPWAGTWNDGPWHNYDPNLYPKGIIERDQHMALTVQIDIKPGSVPNPINPKSHGVIPVAILTTPTFNAMTVDRSTIRFGKSGTEAAPVHVTLADVDGDGDTDLLLHFRTQETGITCGDTSASLTGKTLAGQRIEGTDAIKIVGEKTFAANVALRGTASQSSIDSGGGATGFAFKGIDGDRNGDWYHSSVTHTADGDPDPAPGLFEWWEVKLDRPYSLKQINVFNRTDCCSERLLPFRLTVFHGATPVFSQNVTAFVADITGPDIAGMTFHLSDPVGDRVRVQLLHQDYLSLAEVEVLADVCPRF